MSRGGGWDPPYINMPIVGRVPPAIPMRMPRPANRNDAQKKRLPKGSRSCLMQAGD